MFLLSFLSLLCFLLSNFLYCRLLNKKLSNRILKLSIFMLLSEMFLVWVFDCCLAVNFADLFISATVLLLHLHCHCDGIFFFLSVSFYRSLTSNLPNVNLPNVNLPKVPNLPVNIPLGIPQMPAFSAPSWMAAIYDAECVFSSIDLV